MLAQWLMSMLTYSLCEEIVLFWVIVGVYEFDFVMLLSTWETFLLLSLWLRLFAKICPVLCLLLFYFSTYFFIE